MNPIGIVIQSKRLPNITLKEDMFCNFTLKNDFHSIKAPIAHMSKIKKKAGVNEVASPIAPCAKNHEINNATTPLHNTFPLVSINFMLNTPYLLFYSVSSLLIYFTIFNLTPC